MNYTHMNYTHINYTHMNYTHELHAATKWALHQGVVVGHLLIPTARNVNT